jgi:DNA-directed RNA polymerase subunit H (RpoH/RPB5)
MREEVIKTTLLEIQLNSYEVHLLKLLDKHECRVKDFPKSLISQNFLALTNNVRQNKMIEIDHHSDSKGNNTLYRITPIGHSWIKEYQLSRIKKNIPLIVSNLIAFAALIVAIIALTK